jgi:pimeloyl-ACP methyl ester carboxylesterase
VEEVQRLAAATLSLPARLGHVALLLAALTMAGVTGGLLATEAALPVRTQVALTAMASIASSWAAFATWVLTRRRVLLARHRVVAGRMAVAYSGLFLAGALTAVVIAGAASRTAVVGILTGVVMFVGAVVMLLRARRQVRVLTARRDALERQLSGGRRSDASGPIVLLAVVTSALGPACGGGAGLSTSTPSTGETAVVSRTPADDAELHDPRESMMTAADGTEFAVTEARVRVPELRTGAVPAGEIELAVIRIRRAPVGRSDAPAHIVLAGGPGDSGVELVRNLARQGGATIADLLDGDLIGVDQRGTGRSRPDLSTSRRYELPLDHPGSPEQWQDVMSQACREVAAELRARGVRLEAYNTRESADDVEQVRRALGYSRVVVWGRSYGSHLALALLRRHPAAIERVVLVGPEGPDDTFKLPSRVDEVLATLSEHVARDAELGRRMPDLLAVIRQVLDRLARSPVSASVVHPVTRERVTVTIGAFDLQWLTVQALGDARTAVTLPAAYLKMAAGDFTQVAQLMALHRSRMGVESAMKHMMDLSSGVSAARRAQIEREAASALLGNAINLPGMLLADAWGAPDLGEAFRAPMRSETPVLILAGDLDPRTPVENGRALLTSLPNGRLVVLENAGHRFDLFGSAPIRDLLRDFLRDRPLPTDHITLPSLVFPP